MEGNRLREETNEIVKKIIQGQCKRIIKATNFQQSWSRKKNVQINNNRNEKEGLAGNAFNIKNILA